MTRTVRYGIDTSGLALTLVELTTMTNGIGLTESLQVCDIVYLSFSLTLHVKTHNEERKR